jgi:hypothetical protein
LLIDLCLINSTIKATVVIKKIVIPAYTCGSLSMGKAKQNIAQLSKFVITATNFVNLEPPLSIATRLSNPAKIIDIPAPTNQSVPVLMCNGKAKLICTIPRRIMMKETILIRLCTTRFIHLNWRTSYCSITAKNTTISLLWL